MEFTLLAHKMKIKKNISLKQYTTFRIGGLAKYFCLARNGKDVISALKWAKEKKLPFFVLGGGSNVLISNKGFNGLVIKTGEPLSMYISKGLSWAVGIPGTIQGAVFGNAGAFGKSMNDVVEKVEVFDTKTGKIKILKNKDCKFSYRSSIFKKKQNLIILSVKIRGGKSNAGVTKQYLTYKKEKQPLNLPSAGSIFVNPKKTTAAKLIERCGLKGKTIGKAQISEKHANFIVNLGNAEAKDVKELINLIKKKVRTRFKIFLRAEINFL